MRFFVPLVATLLISACATTPVSAPVGPSGSTTIPAGAIDFGDWRHSDANAVMTQFGEAVSNRYSLGMQIAAVAADLRRNQFNCAANVDTTNRGNPPAHVCRKTVVDSGCTHTWQVHLFDA